MTSPIVALASSAPSPARNGEMAMGSGLMRPPSTVPSTAKAGATRSQRLANATTTVHSTVLMSKLRSGIVAFILGHVGAEMDRIVLPQIILILGQETVGLAIED